MSKIHKFNSTAQAYDACQCDDNINKGDILIVLNEGVIGLADVWPVAVTANYGNLHALAKGHNLRDTTLDFNTDDINRAELLAIKHKLPLNQ